MPLLENKVIAGFKCTCTHLFRLWVRKVLVRQYSEGSPYK